MKLEMDVDQDRRRVRISRIVLDEMTTGKWWRTDPEEEFVRINQWCIDNLGYHARKAYDDFRFRTDSDLTAFILRWS